MSQPFDLAKTQFTISLTFSSGDRVLFSTVSAALHCYWWIVSNTDRAAPCVTVTEDVGNPDLNVALYIDPIHGQPVFCANLFVSEGAQREAWAKAPKWIRRSLERHALHHHRWNDYDGPMYA